MHFRALAACLVLGSAALAGGCLVSHDPPPDSGPPDAAPDADVTADGGVDAGDPDSGTDGGPDAESVATPPAVVEQTGPDGLLLKGAVLAPSGVIDPGEVLIVGDTITCVAASCAGEPQAPTSTVIQTNGIISPGLVDAHNHIAYNFLPEWIPSPPQFFENRYQWANDPNYEAHIEPYAKHRSTGTHYCPAAKWGELRALIHGTTTVQGQGFSQSCINWGARNAEHSFHDTGYDHMRTSIGSPRDITDADAQNYLDSFNQVPDPITRFAWHMAEGYTGDNVDLEWDSFAGRDPRPNRHAGVSLLDPGTALLIHCIPLTEAQLQEALATSAYLVWSPSSNMALYDTTAPIQRILQLGIPTGLGPDWTPSGEDEMLSEMRFGLGYGQQNSIPEITTQRLWEMATVDGALVVGMQAAVARLEPGLRADIAVFGRSGPDPYGAVIDSRAEDVRLVLLDGLGFYGDDYLEAETARNIYCEPIDACGTAKYICVQDSPTAPNRADETLTDIRTQLFNILEGIGYPADEQYGRGSELLELIDCNI